MFLWKFAKLYYWFKLLNKLANEKLTEHYCRVLKVQVTGNDSHQGQTHLSLQHFQTGEKPRGQIREAGWSRFTHMAACRRSLPLFFWGGFLQAVARCFPSQRVGENLQEEREMRRQVRAAAAWPGMTAQECAVRRCGGPATFTHTRGRIDRELDRTGVDSHRWNWRFVCRLLLTIRKMELFTSWVARAWITCAFVTFYAQVKTPAAQTWGGSSFSFLAFILMDTVESE